MKFLIFFVKLVFTVCSLSILSATNVYSQRSISSMGGPRLGATLITGKMKDKLMDQNVFPVITQFGWQFEWRFFSVDEGPTGVVECVPLIGGVEQGKFLPSISTFVGIRSSKGFEFGLGPNVSVSGIGIVLATGVTIQKGNLNWPINFAVAPSSSGVKFTLLIGFNAVTKD
jgi:hypothetical protein